jgi:DNA-directed RNA polymerase subunit M/transcription elongation factor TFIIS
MLQSLERRPRARNEILFIRNIFSGISSLPMETIDQQWQQLKENYTRMTEDELCDLANHAWDLTETAQEALRSVISERGLKIDLDTTPPFVPGVDPTPDEDLVVIARLWDKSEAQRQRDILDAAGVPFYFGPDDLTNLDDFKGEFAAGVDLKVAFFDQRRALFALGQEMPGKEDREEAEDQEYAVLCPKCHSEKIIFEGRDATETTGPQGEAKFDWRCDACGYRWKDEGIEEEVPAGQSHSEESEGDEEDGSSGGALDFLDDIS